MNRVSLFPKCLLYQHVSLIPLRSFSITSPTYKKDRGTQVFKIYRYNPDTPTVKPRMQEYRVDMNKTGMMFLDILIYIKGYMDSTLSFRRSCREGICGSCSMNMNGVNGLACITTGMMFLDILIYIKGYMDSTLSFRRSCREGICGSCSMNMNGVNGLACITAVAKRPVNIVYPLPHMYVIKDLITDFELFYKHYTTIKPFLIRDMGDKIGQKALPQSIRDRNKLDNLYECILCGCCTHSCPAYWWNGDRYLGPAALLHAYRWLIDSRDEGYKERLSELRDKFSVYRCHSIMNCSICCPKNLNPAKAIAGLRLMLSPFTKKETPDM